MGGGWTQGSLDGWWMGGGWAQDVSRMGYGLAMDGPAFPDGRWMDGGWTVNGRFFMDGRWMVGGWASDLIASEQLSHASSMASGRYLVLYPLLVFKCYNINYCKFPLILCAP